MKKHDYRHTNKRRRAAEVGRELVKTGVRLGVFLRAGAELRVYEPAPATHNQCGSPHAVRAHPRPCPYCVRASATYVIH
jgi:hypothetical protein